jgi:GntR family histidine utilization transcriptional repressor
MTTGSYKAVKTAILDRILRQEWRPGARLPPEADLARAYGCARSTANRALQELADQGYLERRRRVGTRVAERRMPGSLLHIPLVRVEIEARGAVYGYRLIDRVEQGATAAVAARLGLAPGAPVLRVRCLHLADGVPYQLESRAISLAAVPQARREGFEAVSPNEWLVGAVPYSASEHAFSAALPEAEEAALLAMSEGQPVFVIERRTWLKGQAITDVRLVHPADRFRLVSRDDWHGQGMGTPPGGMG